MSSIKICKYCGEYERDCKCLSTRHVHKLEQQVETLQKQVEEANNRWNEYCDSYDKMMAVWKDEKRDIAARCGYPWDVNGVGLEPWIAADNLSKEKQQLESRLKEVVEILERLESGGHAGTPINQGCAAMGLVKIAIKLAKSSGIGGKE